MKKNLTLLLIAVFLCILNQGNAFIPQRHQWWDLQVQKLQQEKKTLLKDKADRQAITTLVDRELERACETRRIMASAMDNTTSLSQIKKTFTSDEINKRAKELSAPLYALTKLELLVTESGNKSHIKEAKKQAAHITESILNKEFSQKELSPDERFELTTISPEIWKTLSFELYIGSLIEMNRHDFEAFQDSISESVIDKLKDEGLTLYPADLDTLIINTTLEKSKSLADRPREYSRSALAESWQWTAINSKISKRLNSYKNIKKMLPGATEISLCRLRELHENPGELEKTVFTPFKVKKPAHVLADDADTAGTIKLSIPLQSDTEKLITALDSLRKNHASKISGTENPAFFRRIHNRYTEIIDKHMAETEVRFVKEEQRLVKILDNDSIKKYTIDNEKDFFIAKSDFYDNLHTVQKYAEISIDYLKWLSHKRMKKGDAIVKLHRYRSERNNSYLSYMKSLVEKCINLAPISNKQVHSRFRTCMYRVPDLTRYLASFTGPLYQEHSELSAGNVRQIRTIQSDYSLEVKKASHEISRHANNYSLKKAAIAKQRTVTNTELRQNIAQHDIDTIMTTAREYEELYSSLDYNEKILSLYKSNYDRFHTEARNGSPSSELKKVLDSGSLLTVMQDFDQNRLQTEKAVRTYAKKACQTALARVISLLNYYKRNNITIELAPTHSEMTELKKAVSRTCNIQVSSWKIDDSNYGLIDKKLTAELKRTAHLSAVYKDNGRDSTRGLNKKVSLSGKELSFYLPSGWTEEKPGSVDRYKGMEYTFNNDMLKSSISLVRVPMENKSLKEISDEWIHKEGKKFIQGNWNTCNTLRCYRGIGTDKKKQILETFTIPGKDEAIIISGTTTKSRYNYFKNIFNNMIQSLGF